MQSLQNNFHDLLAQLRGGMRRTTSTGFDPVYYMVGSIAPWPDENADHPLSGPFAAVYCSAFDENFIAD